MLGKVKRFIPAHVAHVQTDGSFRMATRHSRTAVLLQTDTGQVHNQVNHYLTHQNSHESEWQSIYDGILLSIRKDQWAVELENDCFGVVAGIVGKQTVNPKYVDYYLSIKNEIRQLDYFRIKWIPRELNRADSLFRN